MSLCWNRKSKNTQKAPVGEKEQRCFPRIWSLSRASNPQSGSRLRREPAPVIVLEYNRVLRRTWRGECRKTLMKLGGTTWANTLVPLGMGVFLLFSYKKEVNYHKKHFYRWSLAICQWFPSLGKASECAARGCAGALPPGERRFCEYVGLFEPINLIGFLNYH